MCHQAVGAATLMLRGSLGVFTVMGELHLHFVGCVSVYNLAALGAQVWVKEFVQCLHADLHAPFPSGPN